MPTDPLADVPSLIDLRSMADARAWAEAAMVKRPWREEFFAEIARQLEAGSTAPLSVLELGSGPGFLARHLLSSIRMNRYVAFNYSPAMHELARERLGQLAGAVEFVEADFRRPQWTGTLPRVHAIVTVQAVHELRHKRHATPFCRSIRHLLMDSGVLLMYDHFAGDQGMSNTSLFMTPDEHATALEEGGFVRVELLLRKGGLVLYRAR